MARGNTRTNNGPREKSSAKTEADLRRWSAQTSTKREDQAKRIATSMQKAEPSDPYTFNRIYSHLMNGIYSPEDYGFRQ